MSNVVEHMFIQGAMAFGQWLRSRVRGLESMTLTSNENRGDINLSFTTLRKVPIEEITHCTEQYYRENGYSIQTNTGSGITQLTRNGEIVGGVALSECYGQLFISITKYSVPVPCA